MAVLVPAGGRRFAGAEESSGGIGGGAERGAPEVLDLHKTGGLEMLDLIPDRDRASDSLRPGVGVPGQFGREFPLPDHIGEE